MLACYSPKSYTFPIGRTTCRILFQGDWHFCGVIPPVLSNASMKRRSRENDFPTKQIVQLPPTFSDPMEQNEVFVSSGRREIGLVWCLGRNSCSKSDKWTAKLFCIASHSAASRLSGNRISAPCPQHTVAPRRAQKHPSRAYVGCVFEMNATGKFGCRDILN